MDNNAPKIAVLGAGIIGMKTVRILQEKLRNANITLIADTFKDTLSTVAAGVFKPGTSFRGPTPDNTKKWIDESWYYWQDT